MPDLLGHAGVQTRPGMGKSGLHYNPDEAIIVLGREDICRCVWHILRTRPVHQKENPDMGMVISMPGF